MIGISSRWLEPGPDDFDARIRRLLDLELSTILLGHTLSPAEAREWERTLIGGRHRAIAVQNQIVCDPRWLEDGAPARPRPSLCALDENERRFAVEEAIEHLHLADRLEARCLIVEAGSVALAYDRRELQEEYEAGNWRRGGRFVSDAAATEAQRLVQKRLALGERHADALLRSLDRLLTVAAPLGPNVALINRRYLESVPQLAEFPRLFSEFQGSDLKAWLDLGHAEYQDQMGWWDRLLAPTALAEPLAGVTFTDGVRLTDGLPPGEGWIQYGDFLRGLFEWEEAGPPVPVVLRCAPDVDPERVHAGLQHLRERGYLGPPPPEWDPFPRIG